MRSRPGKDMRAVQSRGIVRLVDRRDFPGEGLRGHMEINRRLGDPDYAPTAAVDGWLRRLLAARS